MDLTKYWRWREQIDARWLCLLIIESEFSFASIRSKLTITAVHLTAYDQLPLFFIGSVDVRRRPRLICPHASFLFHVPWLGQRRNLTLPLAFPHDFDRLLFMKLIRLLCSQIHSREFPNGSASAAIIMDLQFLLSLQCYTTFPNVLME